MGLRTQDDLSVRWEHRGDRAAFLAERNPWAGEVLRFYEHILRFQKTISRSTARLAPQDSGNLRDSLDLSRIAERFPELCQVVHEHGTEAMRKGIDELRRRSRPEIEMLLKQVASGQSVTEMERMAGLSLLQPYAESAASQRKPPMETAAMGTCPSCGGLPVAGVLRPEGDGAKRWLVCSFCLKEWEFRRILCPYCREESHEKLPIFSPENDDPVRVHACQTCRRYLKIVDMTRDGHAVALVDDVATAPLDIWAGEHGYQKIEKNLLGY